ncbi:hypothetical protein CR513_08829, partial [Mucuna pruriens]
MNAQKIGSKSFKKSSSKAFKVEESCEEASNEEGSNEDELSFISRKIHSVWKNKRGFRWKKNSKRYTKEVKDKSQVVCYECKKLGNLKSECPSLEKEKEKKKSFFKKKKGLMATWEDLDLSFFEEEDKEANICLMTDTTSKDEEKENDLLKKENKSLKEEKTNDLFKVNTLELLHIDLFTPTITASMMESVMDLSDHGGEFKNESFQKFCEEHDILHKESIHLKFNDSKPDKKLSELNDSFIDMNIDGLQTSSKETCLDKQPKDDQDKPTLKELQNENLPS